MTGDKATIRDQAQFTVLANRCGLAFIYGTVLVMYASSEATPSNLVEITSF